MHELTRKITEPYTPDFMNDTNAKIIDGHITDYLKEKAVEIFEQLIGDTDDNDKTFKELDQIFGLSQKTLEEKFIAAFGFTQVDIKQNNWRALRVIELAQIAKEHYEK